MKKLTEMQQLKLESAEQTSIISRKYDIHGSRFDRKKRKCLNCTKKFNSMGKANRICCRCQEYNDYQSKRAGEVPLMHY